MGRGSPEGFNLPDPRGEQLVEIDDHPLGDATCVGVGLRPVAVQPDDAAIVGIVGMMLDGLMAVVVVVPTFVRVFGELGNFRQAV